MSDSLELELKLQKTVAHPMGMFWKLNMGVLEQDWELLPTESPVLKKSNL